MDVHEEKLKIQLKLAELKGQRNIMQGQLNGINCQIEELGKVDCPDCNGKGTIKEIDIQTGDQCPFCGGTGKLIGKNFK